MTFISQVYGEFIKKLKLWRRRPVLMLVGIFSPFVMSFFVIACFAALAQMPVWQIGFVDEDHSIYSENLKEAIISTEGTIPYYQIATEDWEQAKSLYDNGKLFMIVRIPAGFGEKLAQGQSADIEAFISNAHSDQTKNLRMGLDARLYQYYEKYLLSQSHKPGITYTYSLEYPQDIPRSTYIAAGVLMLVIILASMLYPAAFAALEHQEKTGLEIEMAPRGRLASMCGTILAAFIEVFVVFCIVGVINGLLWGLKLPDTAELPYILLAFLMLSLMFAIIGYGYGNKVKDIKLVLAPVIVTSLTLWMISGGMNNIQAAAAGKLLALLPTAAAIHIMVKGFARLESISFAYNLGIITVWLLAVALIFSAVKGLRRSS